MKRQDRGREAGPAAGAGRQPQPLGRPHRAAPLPSARGTEARPARARLPGTPTPHSSLRRHPAIPAARGRGSWERPRGRVRRAAGKRRRSYRQNPPLGKPASPPARGYDVTAWTRRPLSMLVNNNNAYAEVAETRDRLPPFLAPGRRSEALSPSAGRRRALSGPPLRWRSAAQRRHRVGQPRAGRMRAKPPRLP